MKKKVKYNLEKFKEKQLSIDNFRIFKRLSNQQACYFPNNNNRIADFHLHLENKSSNEYLLNSMNKLNKNNNINNSSIDKDKSISNALKIMLDSSISNINMNNRYNSINYNIYNSQVILPKIISGGQNQSSLKYRKITNNSISDRSNNNHYNINEIKSVL